MVGPGPSRALVARTRLGGGPRPALTRAELASTTTATTTNGDGAARLQRVVQRRRAAHEMQYRAAGIASSRAGTISWWHDSQVP
jgi:hypothetical protein